MFLSLVESLFVSVDLVHQCSEVFSNSVNVFVSVGDGLGHLLPLREQDMPLVMFLLELLRCLIKLDLTRLGRCDFLVKFLLLPRNFQGQLLNLQIQFPDFCVVLLSVFLQYHIVFFLLLTGDGPLLELFLVPVQL